MNVTACTDATPGTAATWSVSGAPNPCWTSAPASPPTYAVNAAGAPAVRRAPASSVSTAPLAIATMTATTAAVRHRRRNTPRVLSTTARTQLLGRMRTTESSALAAVDRWCQHPLRAKPGKMAPCLRP